ncbi:PH domain-containing protein [Imperialibacter roseus]|uniref:PH domain-containing protein n=1 Tax=Imperialibacter roseus TaxID=1324217 RepID=A0ABZ0IR01_9BACT|nr:PH domain-containing protein [Imperialibacter roseus]WOK07487.1 PH domain-containing protein [Imperialibacter roseus]
MTSLPNNYYSSRKSFLVWLIVLLLAYLGTANIYRSIVSMHTSSILISLAIWIPILVFILTIFFGTGYTIKDNILIVKIGPFTADKVDIRDIWTAHRTYTVLSAPANSVKRLRIKYKDGEVVISPERENEFLATLKQLNPTIEVLV